MFKRNQLKARRQLRDTNEALAILNRELVAKMISLSAQNSDVEPLIEAVQNIAKTSGLYTQQNTNVEHAQLQKALGDTLFKLARVEEDKRALDHAIIAYRGAITVASMLGETRLRNAAKKNCGLAMNLRGMGDTSISLYSAA